MALSGRQLLFACLSSLIFLACQQQVTQEDGGSPSDPDPSTEPSDPPSPTPVPKPTEHPAGCDADASWSGDVALGTGEHCFQPLSDGSSIALIAGPQGGYHLWIALRCSDCSLSETVEFSVLDDSGEPVQLLQKQVAELWDFGAYGEGAGLQALMPGFSFETENRIPDYMGQAFTLWLKVGGVEREVTVVVDSLDEWWGEPCEEEGGAPGEECFG